MATEQKEQSSHIDQLKHTIDKLTIKLSQSDERYKMLQKAANIGSWDWDIITGELEWSEQIEPMFGYDKGEFKGTYEAFMAVVHPDDRAFVQSKVDAALHLEKPYDIEHRIVWPDGTLKWVSEKGRVFRNQQGDPVQMVGIVQEISDRKAVEIEKDKSYEALESVVIERTADLKKTNDVLWDKIQKLKQAELELLKSGQTLQGIFDGISDPLLLIDKELKIIKYNKAANQYFHISDNRTIKDVFCHEKLFGNSRICENCPIGKIDSQKYMQTFERTCQDGKERMEQVYLYPVLNRKKELEHTVVRIHDITERKLLEKKLIQSEKLVSIGILVSGIAHEINNPNNFITFNLPILKDYLNEIMPIVDEYAKDKPDLEFFYMPYGEFREDMFKLLENVEHGSKRITSIVNELKEFTRTNQDKKTEQVNIKNIINKVATFTRSKIKRSVKTFDINIEGNIPLVTINPQAMEQVLVNILINASQAFQNGDRDDSKITLNASYDDQKDRLSFEIRDNGCGMDEEAMGKLFNPFYTTKAPDQGTGLGLYICHNLVSNMNGRIEVESKINEGTLFTVMLDNITSENGKEA